MQLHLSINKLDNNIYIVCIIFVCKMKCEFSQVKPRFSKFNSKILNQSFKNFSKNCKYSVLYAVIANSFLKIHVWCLHTYFYIRS